MQRHPLAIQIPRCDQAVWEISKYLIGCCHEITKVYTEGQGTFEKSTAT
jgi:hypothetical protein